MRYFENLPVILNYDSINTDEMAKMRNIFYRLDIVNLDSDYSRFYRIDGHKRLDTISFELYGTVDYWWIIAIINNMHDIVFDIPLEEEILKQIAMDRTLVVYATIEDVGALPYYTTQVEELLAENDEKRLIRVVNQRHIGKVITEILKRL